MLFARGDLSEWVEEQHHFYKAKHPNTKTWSFKDGMAVCDGSTGNCGYLRYKKKLSDFVLRLEYRTAKNCNSGVCIRTPVPYDGQPNKTLPSHTGYEVQILDDGDQPATKTSSGALYGLVAPRASAARPAGQWNTMEIVCRGPKIRVTLNGQVVQDVDQRKIEVIRDRPQAGYLSLQNHGGNIEFRNLWLKEDASSGIARAAAPAFSWQETPTSLALLNGDKAVWKFVFDPKQAKPYFHPLATIDGEVLTAHRPPIIPGIWACGGHGSSSTASITGNTTNTASTRARRNCSMPPPRPERTSLHGPR